MSEDQNEDGQQAETPKAKKSWKSITFRILKTTAMIAVIVFILLTILSRLGGNSDILKETIEDYLSQDTPYTARITTLNQMHFFPSIVIDVEGIEFREGDGNGEAIIRIGEAKLAFRFFDVMFRPGHLQKIYLKNLNAAPGSLHSKPVKIEIAEIKEEEGRAFLDINGAIGAHPLSGQFDLSTSGKEGHRIYAIGGERQFILKLGKLTLDGSLKNTVLGILKLENTTLSIGEQKALRGNFDLDHNNDGVFKINAQMRLEPGKTQIDPKLEISKEPELTSISGAVNSEFVLTSDLGADAPFMRVLDELGTILGSESEALNLAGTNIDIALNIQNIKAGALHMGDMKTPVNLKDSALHIGPIEGQIIGGALSGDIHLDAAEQPATLENKITIKNFDYASLQKQISETAEIEGTAHITVALKSSGKTLDALISGLSGKVGMVGGKGKMRSGLLNLWGGGLLGTLLPSFEEDAEMNLNCIVVNMDVENFKGRSDAVFVDTDRITLHGEGTYDFKTDQLEMVLDPKPKDISIGDVSAAVNIAGPLSDLSVSPNVFDLGKKVGGLLLGAVNPAFYAVTLADLGLNDDHPCKAFVIEKEILPPPEEKMEATPEPDSSADAQDQSAPNE